VLSNLQSLYLSETKVSDDQVAELKKALPKAQIIYTSWVTRNERRGNQ